MSLPSAQRAVPIPGQGYPAGGAEAFCAKTFDHDFVIGLS
jgi:hypothetical protein